MEQIQYLLDCINGRNYEEPDDDFYDDENSHDNYADCHHKPEVVSAATSPKEKNDLNDKPSSHVAPKKKKMISQGGKKHAVSQYKSPFVLDAERRAKERIRQAQAKKRGFQQPEWNLDTKVPILFDPNLKKQEIFKLRPRNIQHGYEYDDGSEYLPSNTNDPTLLRPRKNASNNHMVVVGPTENRGITKRTFGFSPSNNPIARIGNNRHVSIEAHQEPSSQPITIEHSPSPPRVRQASPSPLHSRPEHDHPHHQQQQQQQQYPYHTHRVAPCVSANTSPVSSVDLDRCPALFRPSALRPVNPYHTATTIDHHVATRATSPFEEREINLILHGSTGDESAAPYPGDGRGHFRPSPQHFEERDRPISVPSYRPSNSQVGSEVEYFTDILREKLSKALSADKRKSAPPKSPAAAPRSHTPPPPPPPPLSAASGSEALMQGMGHLMAAVGDIITSTRAAAAPPPAAPYFYPYSAVGPPPAFAVQPPLPPAAWGPTLSPSAAGPSTDLFAKPPPRQPPIPFDLAGICLDPSQHIAGNFLQHTAGKKAHKKPGKGRSLSSQELLEGINFAPIGAPPVQSRSEMMDVILQKLQAIDQSEREIHHFLQRNTHSAQGVPFYPSTSQRPLQPLTERNQPPADRILERAAQARAAFDPSRGDEDDEDDLSAEEQEQQKMRRQQRREEGVHYSPGGSDLQTYLSLAPQPKPSGALRHHTYDDITAGVDAKLIGRVAGSLLPKGLNRSAKVSGAVEVGRDPQKEVEYLSQFPALRTDSNMNDEVFKFMKDLDLTRQMKEVAFSCRGVTMAQVADTATEAIMCKLLDGVTEDVDGIIGKYSDKFIDKI